jgi:hypothetical protein
MRASALSVAICVASDSDAAAYSSTSIRLTVKTCSLLSKSVEPCTGCSKLADSPEGAGSLSKS